MTENSPFELLELGPWLDAQLGAEVHSCVAIDAKRVGLPTRPVVRWHELSPKPLAQWVGDDQLLELGNQLAVQAEAESEVYTLFDRADAELVQTRGLCARLRGGLGGPETPEGEVLCSQLQPTAP